MKVSGIVLAGGRSSRMGQDKTLMSVNAETLIERTIRELRKVADEVIIASNQKSKYNIPGTIEIPDIFPGRGPLGGIHAGLLAARYPLSFVVAADMPFFTADMANYLLSKSAGYDVVAPEINHYWEPLCAVYAKDCLQAIEQFLVADVKKVYAFYPCVRVLKVKEEELTKMGKIEHIFCNLNTPEDYQSLLMSCKDCQN